MTILTPEESELVAARQTIDAIDDQLVTLLRQRVIVACNVQRLKTRLGLPSRDAAREREVETRVMAQAELPLDCVAVLRIFRRIMDETWRTSS